MSGERLQDAPNAQSDRGLIMILGSSVASAAFAFIFYGNVMQPDEAHQRERNTRSPYAS